eukprot:TRINITY_DN999_c0_g2_i3.p1 TRINITY_DN999_c0_g2~~TRINITY_DN999_c0_g2_i3.p1  ORF type:complete len:196 (-),score=25.25 TRINITY_DN999_c0_g2_i3:646-1233(-)
MEDNHADGFMVFLNAFELPEYTQFFSALMTSLILQRERQPRAYEYCFDLVAVVLETIAYDARLEFRDQMICAVLAARSRDGLSLSAFLLHHCREPNVHFDNPKHFATAFHARQILVALDPPPPPGSPAAAAISEFLSDPDWPHARCANAHCTATSPAELKKCARCESVRYCSVECQTADWPQHKTGCRKKKKPTT